ncbi:AraC family transcriptional regulator [Nocardiaceae bacterium YC2-7]|uniref:AraC family transcriptional regulator n=1 Tax=Antrihabitans stalactiti TaxID=2584121 RepID=A0A848KAN5_9NOCA|nr:AraC family transcriptional regulator [Antrihabitans stalactiti]
MTVDWDLPRTPTSILVLLRLAADHDVPAQVCLRGTGIRADRLQQPNAEVTGRDEQLVIANLLDALGNRAGLGVEAGNRYHLTTYGIWGFALISSPTLRSAIDVGLRYLDLTFAFTHIHTREQNGEFQFVLDTPGIPVPLQRFAVERDASAIRLLERELFAAPTPVERASFIYPAPDDVGPYIETFGVTPEFGAQENILALPPALLDLPLPQANEHTAALAQAQCRDMLQQRNERAGLAGRVRDLLLANPAAPPSAEQVAHELNMSSRTLRHRLGAEGTSFRDLLDEVRQRLAEEMLVSGRLTVAETAQRLGYVELSSFSQAFRRWNGMGPRAYRNARLPARR